MKKGVIIVLAVALLGLAAFYAKSSSRAGEELKSDNNSSRTSTSSSKYRDGTYEGNAAETLYGPVKIAVVVSSSKISDVKFLEMPDDDARSTQITNDSTPLLKKAAIKAQNSEIDFVSGATSTSYGYQESLQYALDQAKS